MSADRKTSMSEEQGVEALGEISKTKPGIPGSRLVEDFTVGHQVKTAEVGTVETSMLEISGWFCSWSSVSYAGLPLSVGMVGRCTLTRLSRERTRHWLSRLLDLAVVRHTWAVGWFLWQRCRHEVGPTGSIHAPESEEIVPTPCLSPGIVRRDSQRQCSDGLVLWWGINRTWWWSIQSKRRTVCL